MADLCDNEFWITGDEALLDEFKEKADERLAELYKRDPFHGEDYPSVLSFHRLFPVPDDIIERTYAAPGGGHDWEQKNWGVKWGAYDAMLAVEDEGLLYTMKTAWVPPYPFLEKVSASFPELTFTLYSTLPISDWREEVTFRAGSVVDDI